MNLYQSEASQKIDKLIQTHLKLSEIELIERASQASLDLIQAQFPKTQKIIIFAGIGNNGADGLVLAKLAFLIGYQVEIISFFNRNQTVPEPIKKIHQQLNELNIQLSSFEDYGSKETILNQLNSSDLIVDAIFGIGLSRPAENDFKTAIQFINLSTTTTFSIDIPSGFNIDTGCSLGEVVQADSTITFITHKFGIYSSKGSDICGKVYFSDLKIDVFGLIKQLKKEEKISEQEFQSLLPCATSPKIKAIKKLLPKRKNNSHKNTFGTSLLIGGNFHMAGAIVLAAKANQKMGAGLTQIITRKKQAQILPLIHPEMMTYQSKDLDDLLKADTKLSKTRLAIAIGPGLGQDNWAKNLLTRFLEFQIQNKQSIPAVLDADALNLLAELKHQNKLTKDNSIKNWVLTPHPKEAARLLGTDVETVESDRLLAVKKLHHIYNSVIVLKGKGSLIFDGKQIYHCRYGNSAMAKGGMGDLLTGMIASLLAQKIKPSKAALIGTIFHSYFADVASKKMGIRSLAPTDLLNQIKL